MASWYTSGRRFREIASSYIIVNKAYMYRIVLAYMIVIFMEVKVLIRGTIFLNYSKEVRLFLQ